MDENEEEEKNEPASTEEEDNEDEATISSLFAALNAAVERIAQLENRLSECESRLSTHESGFEHKPIPAAPESRELEPDPAHWYFKRVGK